MPAVPTVVPWLLAGLALLMAALRAFRIFKYGLNAEVFGAVVKRQIASGALDRVEKICSIIPETALGPAMSAANQAAMAMKGKEPTPSEDEIRAAMRAAYEPAFDAAVRPIFDGRWMVVMAIGAGAAAVVTGMTAEPPVHVAAGAGALALMVAAWSIRVASQALRSAHFLDDVLPSYVDHVRHRISTMDEMFKKMGEKHADENPYREAKPEPIDVGDPRAWPATLDSVLYGFDARSPDLFFEIVVAPFAREIGGLRTAKLRRDGGDPKFVVAVFGPSDALRRFRDKVEKEAPSRYASCTTPAAEIAPDASYGPETRTRSEVLDELRGGRLDVVSTG